MNPKLDAPAKFTDAMSRTGNSGHWWVHGLTGVKAGEALDWIGAKLDGRAVQGFKAATNLECRFLSCVL